MIRRRRSSIRRPREAGGGAEAGGRQRRSGSTRGRTPLPKLGSGDAPSSLGNSGELERRAQSSYARRRPAPSRAATSFPGSSSSSSARAANYHKRCLKGSARPLQDVLVCTTETSAYGVVLQMRFRVLLESRGRRNSIQREGAGRRSVGGESGQVETGFVLYYYWAKEGEANCASPLRPTGRPTTVFSFPFTRPPSVSAALQTPTISSSRKPAAATHLKTSSGSASVSPVLSGTGSVM